jgi:hypothetical protein
MAEIEPNQILVEFFKLIPRIFCISYISNHERRNKIQLLWKKLGIEDRVEYVYGFPGSDYKCSCKVIHDHVSVFIKAHEEKWPFVFVFEDDAELHENMLNIELEEIRKFLESEKKWSILTLGYDPRHFFLYDSWGKFENEKKNILFRMNGLFSHSYIISRRGIERFLTSWRIPIHPLHIGVIDSFFLIDNDIYGLTHNIFKQSGFDMSSKFNPINSYLFRFINLVWWNRVEYIVGAFVMILFLIGKMKIYDKYHKSNVS